MSDSANLNYVLSGEDEEEPVIADPQFAVLPGRHEAP